jgi:hypothetical protein
MSRMPVPARRQRGVDDLGHQHVGQQRRDVGRVDVAPCRHGPVAAPPLPVVEQPLQLRMHGQRITAGPSVGGRRHDRPSKGSGERQSILLRVHGRLDRADRTRQRNSVSHLRV